MVLGGVAIRPSSAATDRPSIRSRHQGDDLPRRELRSLIARRGIGACLDPRRFEGELVGVCGHFEKEVFVLIAALKKDVVSELVRVSDTSPIEERMTRITGRLCDIGLERQAAAWAVETWARALGLIEAAGQPFLAEGSAAPKPIEYEFPHCLAEEEAVGPGGSSRSRDARPKARLTGLSSKRGWIGWRPSQPTSPSTMT